MLNGFLLRGQRCWAAHSDLESCMRTFSPTLLSIIGVAVMMLFVKLLVRSGASKGQIISPTSKELRVLEKMRQTKAKTVVITEAEEARAILQQSTLSSRALPNKNMSIVFDIENSFTTTDQVTHRQFKRRAQRLITPCISKPAGLQRLAEEVTAAVEVFLCGEEETVEDVVQASVLVVVLGVLFPENRLPRQEWKQSMHHLNAVAKEINDIWVLSKSERVCRDALRLQQLRNAIAHLTPGYEGPDQLGLLIPAFETLWRVVLRGFLELSRASGYRAHSYAATLSNYLLNPSMEVFREKHSFETVSGAQSVISASSIVSELLRLYPPTKRIHRCVGDALYAIDVEAIHRTPHIWNEALEFLPERWLGKTPKAHFLPFGGANFACPAGPGFAPQIIGLFVGALLQRVKEKGCWVNGLEALGRTLSNSRSDVYEVRFMRKA